MKKGTIVLAFLVLFGLLAVAQSVNWTIRTMDISGGTALVNISAGQTKTFFLDKNSMSHNSLDVNSALYIVTPDINQGLIFSWSDLNEQVCDFKLAIGLRLLDINLSVSQIEAYNIMPGDLVGLQVTNTVTSGAGLGCHLNISQDLNIA